jgi:hypothetical protein
MSPVTKWKLLAIVGWLIALGFIGIGALMKVQSRSGGGFGIDSPDRTSVAWLNSYRKIGPFVHDTNVWIEVCIQPIGGSGVADPKFLRFSSPDKDIEDEMYARDNDGVISWSPDSKTVRVLLPSKEILITK